MKLLLATLLFSSLTAHAVDFNSLASISNVKITVKTGGGLAAVQPYSTLSFDFNSCQQFDLQLKKTIKTTANAKYTLLSVVIPRDQRECRGLGTKRTYSLQISSDASLDSQYVIANPIAAEYK